MDFVPLPDYSIIKPRNAYYIPCEIKYKEYGEFIDWDLACNVNVKICFGSY